MSATLEVQGGRELRATLKKAGSDLSDLKAAHKAAAETVKNHSTAPTRTGRLARSVRAAGTKTAGIVRAGNNTAVPYAAPIHWGWGRRHIPANPWISRAATQTEPVWITEYERAVDDALAQVRGA